MRLLLVEKSAPHADLLLLDDRWSIHRADAIAVALSLLRQDVYDIVLLNIASLGPDGFTFIRQLRLSGDDTPVVALTGHQTTDRTCALGLGADDAIAQPVNTEEVQARMTAVIRRSKAPCPLVLQIGSFSLSLKTHEIQYDKKLIHITAKECAVLELLMLRKGMVISKEMLLNHLYGGLDEPEIKIIDVFICKLRRRLNQLGIENVIDTVWGRGYTISNRAVPKPLSNTMISQEAPKKLVA